MHYEIGLQGLLQNRTYLPDYTCYFWIEDLHYKIGTTRITIGLLSAGLGLPFLEERFALQDLITGFTTCRTLITMIGQEISTITNGLQGLLHAGLKILILDKRSTLQDITTRNVICRTIATIFGQELFTTRQDYKISYMPDFDYYLWTSDQHYYYWITRNTICRTKDTIFG